MSSSPATRNPLRRRRIRLRRRTSTPSRARSALTWVSRARSVIDASAKADARLSSDRVCRPPHPAVGVRTGCSTTSTTGRSSSTRITSGCGSSTSTTTSRGSCGSPRWRGQSSTWPSSRRTASPLSSTPRPTWSTRRSTTAVNVAVGSFFGGGYFPGFGLPLPPPPPPVLRYDNVPVLVNYSNARYEPFRVRRIVDVGDDPRFGERKVLLDGATPAWGVWTQTASGERQFEVHKTQQYPGLDDPQEAPLPGDYQLRLASDETPSGMSGRRHLPVRRCRGDGGTGLRCHRSRAVAGTSPATALRRAHNERGAPAVGAPLRMHLCQRLCCTLVSTCGTVTCGWMSWTQSWWPMSAWAGPARPRTAAVSPLAMMVANPNFFIALSFSSLFEPWR